jgi:hypothetical protein
MRSIEPFTNVSPGGMGKMGQQNNAIPPQNNDVLPFSNDVL